MKWPSLSYIVTSRLSHVSSTAEGMPVPWRVPKRSPRKYLDARHSEDTPFMLLGLRCPVGQQEKSPFVNWPHWGVMWMQTNPGMMYGIVRVLLRQLALALHGRRRS